MRLQPLLRYAHITQGLNLLPILATIYAAFALQGDPFVGMLLFTAAFQLVPTLLYTYALFGEARVEVDVDAQNLRIHRVNERGGRRTDTLSLASIEAAYVLEPNTQGHLRRLRIARREGDVFVPAHNVPPASAEWLANQISRVARLAKERDAGEATPELLALLDQRTRAEAERKLRLQRQATRSP